MNSRLKEINKCKTSQHSHSTRHLQLMVNIKQLFLPPIIPVLMTNATLCSFPQVGNQEAILNFSVPMTSQYKTLPKFCNFLTSYLLISQLLDFFLLSLPAAISQTLFSPSGCPASNLTRLQSIPCTADRVLSLVHEYITLLNKTLKYLPTPFCH